MRLHKQITSIALAFTILSASLFSTACGPDQLASNAERVASALERAQPAFQTLIEGGVISRSAGAQIISRIIQGASDARVLASAFRSNNATGAVEKTAALIRTVEQVIDADAKLIPAGGRRTAVLAILSVADIALGFISDQLVKQGHAHHALTAAQSNSDAAVIRRYARKPRLRCRNSMTGRFEKMEVCKAHPDITTVERVEPKVKTP